MFIKNYYDYLLSINEGLIKTAESNKSFEYTIDLLMRLGFNVGGSFSDDRIIIEINNFNTIDASSIDSLFDLVSANMTNLLGWFPSGMKLTNLNGSKISKRYDEEEIKLKRKYTSLVEIEFDSKFDDIIKEKFDKLYHLSIQEYENSILKNGLYPRSKSKLSSHIDRIYLCSSVEDCKILIPQMNIHYNDEYNTHHYELGNKKYKKNVKWIIYEIENKVFKLYKDPRYINGYYTMDNISPNLIKVYSKE